MERVVRQWLAPFAEENPYSGEITRDRFFVPDIGPRLLVLFAVMIYAFHYGDFTLTKMRAVEQTAFDAGIFDQGVWLLSRFKSPFVTIMGLNLFGDHASYILLGFVPLYWIHPSIDWLLAGQTLSLATAAIPVYLLGKRFLNNSWLAVLLALAFLLNPALAYLNLENFHPDSFEVLLALLVLYYMVQHRWRTYFVMLCLLLLVKEDVAFLVVPLSIYIALRHDKKIGFITADLAIVWFVLTVFFLGPLLSGDTAGSLDSFRIPFGGWKGLFTTAVNQPWEALGYMVTSAKIKYLVQLATPLFFLPLLSAEALVVLPTLLFNLLSTFSYQTNVKYHYTSLIIPVFAWAGLLSLRRMKDLGTQRAFVVIVLLAAVFSAYMWGPAGWSRDPAARFDPNDSQVLAIKEALALIPDNAVVSARSRISTQIDHREKIYDYPTPFAAYYYGDDSDPGQRLPVADSVEYVVELPDHLSDIGASVWASLQDNEGFRVIFSKDGVVVLKKETGTGSAPGAQARLSTGRSVWPAPSSNQGRMEAWAAAG